MKIVMWFLLFFVEKMWNRKLFSDIKEKKLDIDGGDFGGKLWVWILLKIV